MKIFCEIMSVIMLLFALVFMLVEKLDAIIFLLLCIFWKLERLYYDQKS